MGSVAAGAVVNRLGGEDQLVDAIKQIPLIGPFIGAGIKFFSDLLGKVMDVGRNVIAGEEAEADEGLRERFASSPALRQAAEAVGGTAAQQQALVSDLKEIIDSQIRSDTGIDLNVDVAQAVASSVTLRDALTERLVNAYKTQNEGWEGPDVPVFTARARAMADAISGYNSTEAANINANNSRETGYRGALLQAMTAVAAEGDMQKSMVDAIRIPENVAALARAVIPANVVPAPEGGAPTPGNGNAGPAAPAAGV